LRCPATAESNVFTPNQEGDNPPGHTVSQIRPVRGTNIGSFDSLGEENIGKDTLLKNYIENKPLGNTS
jgi:hypothetical protein